MLSTDPKDLYAEIEAAEELRTKHLATMRDQIEKYHGPYYKEGYFSGYAAENHYYEYISLIVPRLIFDNPRVRVGTRRPGTQDMVARAIRLGLNRWIRDTNLRESLTDVATDMVFNYGVLLVTEEENKTLRPKQGIQKPSHPMRPTVTRIPQDRFIVDAAATTMNDARFVGHRWVRDKEDLEEMAHDNPDDGWDIDAIKSLTATTDNSELGRTNDRIPDRKEVVCYEVWIPEVQIDEEHTTSEGFHGTIYTLGVASAKDADEKIAFVREPRPYYGPRWGPYTMFGLYNVPNAIYPLGSLTAIEGQIEELNRHAESAASSADQYKKLILVDNTDPKFVQRVKDAKDNYVIPVSGLERAGVVQAEVGGMTAQQLNYLQVARDRLDRNSGLTDAQRGNVEGRGTATEVTVAAEAGTARMAFMKRQFSDSVQRVLCTVAWYLYYDDRVVMPLGVEAEREFGQSDPWLVGGEHDPESGASFDDLELEIEPYSMERTTEGTHQRRTMEMFNLITSTAPLIPQLPFVNWKELYHRIGDAFNVPDIGSLIDPDLAREMVQAGEIVPDGKKPDDPRLSKDMGPAAEAGKARPKITEADRGGIAQRAQMENMMGQQTGTEAQRMFQGGM